MSNRKLLYWMGGIALSLSLAGCMPVVKTDLRNLNDHPEEFKGKKVIVTADLESLVADPTGYDKKRVELSGYVEMKDFRRGNDWSFTLGDGEGNFVKCYERGYRIDSWILPEMALRRAAREKGQVTVIGKVEKNRLKIELDSIDYQGQHFSTDYKPPMIVVPWF
jgi:hypothetical protein